MPATNPFPGVTIPGLTTGVNYCITRVDRSFDGVFEGQQAASYRCGAGRATKKTGRFIASVTWRITAALACDESLSIWPPTLLTARGVTVARVDDFAHFFGRFTVAKKTQGQPDVTYFKGVLELIARSGSHQKLGEACDEAEHIEGWLVGQGQGPAAKLTLRAAVVAKGGLAPGVSPFPDASVNRITGTLVKSP